MASKAIEILTRVKDLAGVSASITTEDNAILRRISDVQWWLYHVNPNWRGLQSYQDLTVTHAVEYLTVPSDVAGVFSIRSLEDSGNMLIYISPSKYNSLMPDAANFTEGEPLYYTWWGGRFWFYPVPDDAYVFKLWYYKKPTNLKIYSTGTAAGQATAITGTSSYWLDNSNVDTSMFFAYQGDARSDGTFPWATITTVTSNTALVTSDYSGALGVATIAYYCSSEIAFPAEFDQLIQLKAAHLTAIRNRENKELTTFLNEEIGVLYSALLRSQIYTPDSCSVLEDFTPGGVALVGDAWKQPFVRSN